MDMPWYKFFLEHPTEWLLALLNALLVLYTARLWHATRTLVLGAEDTAKRQLRAYISLEHIFFIESGLTNTGMSYLSGDDYSVKIRIRNHGQTPAHQMTIWSNSIEKAPAVDFDYPYPGSEPTVREQ